MACDSSVETYYPHKTPYVIKHTPSSKIHRALRCIVAQSDNTHRYMVSMHAHCATALRYLSERQNRFPLFEFIIHNERMQRLVSVWSVETRKASYICVSLYVQSSLCTCTCIHRIIISY